MRQRRIPFGSLLQMVEIIPAPSLPKFMSKTTQNTAIFTIYLILMADLVRQTKLAALPEVNDQGSWMWMWLGLSHIGVKGREFKHASILTNTLYISSYVINELPTARFKWFYISLQQLPTDYRKLVRNRK